MRCVCVRRSRDRADHVTELTSVSPRPKRSKTALTSPPCCMEMTRTWSSSFNQIRNVFSLLCLDHTQTHTQTDTLHNIVWHDMTSTALTSSASTSRLRRLVMWLGHVCQADNRTSSIIGSLISIRFDNSILCSLVSFSVSSLSSHFTDSLLSASGAGGGLIFCSFVVNKLLSAASHTYCVVIR